MVGAPVGELAAGVFIPPAKLGVAAILAVGDLGRLAQPHVPVQLGRGIDRGERAARGPAADRRGDLADLADPAVPHHGDGEQEHAVVVASLLGADLHHAFGFLGDLAELLALVNREGERLLAIDVFACAWRRCRSWCASGRACR